MAAAAILTIAAASISGMFVLITAAAYALVGSAILDDFDDTGSLVAWFFAVTGGLLGLCTAAVVASVGLLRRRGWAWWTLLALTPVTAVLGVLGGYYLLPLGAAATAVTIFVLLLLRPTRAWIASPTT